MTDSGDLATGNIDPTRLDAAAKPKRKRRRRNRPEPAPELRQWEKAAEKRAAARPYPPGILLEPAGFDEEHWTAPHSDVDLWTLQLADAFGTRSRAVMSTFMEQLKELCRPAYWDDTAKQWRMDENHFSAAIAIVNTVKPRNELEAALAAQMVAIHVLTMKVAARAIRFEHESATVSAAGKLARTFASQMETLQSLRRRKRGTRQTISVRKELHQHVHYHRGKGENDGQPHGRPAALVDQCAALPSPEQGGQSVPLPGGKGQGKVQAPRRR